MKISYNWLKDYVDFDLSPAELAEALTSIGLETGSVEEVQTIKGGLEGLVVGHVLTCVAHPNSDHLHITQVDLGTGEPVQIVCGASNVAAGQKVVVATIGTKLYDGDNCITIKKSKMRGEESYGMICAEDEIGIGTSHDGIIVLPDDVAPGTPAKEYYNIKSDYVLEVDITPNRADACSHYGVARDLYAYLVRNGRPTALRSPLRGDLAVDNHDIDIDVQVENTEACPLYSGVSIKGVKVGESPEWLKTRLSAIGVRPINNIVDITNYIVHETGQPLHCFDADCIGGKVIVKTVPSGTKFKTLDDVERILDEHDLMICSADGPMCIAGVFGGEGSGVKDSTVNVFLESAYFNPTWVRKTARRHGLSTDASFRYERGIDPLAVIDNLKHAANLVKELAGGTVSSEIKVAAGKQFDKFKVELQYDYVNRLVGAEISREMIKTIVGALEMEIVAEDENGLTLLVPPYRVDVQRPCDVVEDILRIYGYNNVEIPTALKSCLTVKGVEDESVKMQNIVSEQLVGCGFNEIMNNSLTPSRYYDGLSSYAGDHLVRLINPLSSDLDVLRQTLLFGGLETIAHNANRKSANLRLFEFGNCYQFDESRRKAEHILSPYSEGLHLGMWLTGKRVEGSWMYANDDSSVYELKAHVENILRRAGFDLNRIDISSCGEDIFSTAIEYKTQGGKTIAKLGIVAKKLLKMTDIDAPVYYADIAWPVLMKQVAALKVSFREIPKYPAVHRDLALLVDKDVKFEQIRKTALDTEKKILKDITLFDVYEGKNLEEGKKSYAISLVLQDDNNTLNDKQIDKVMQRLVSAFQTKLGAKLR